MEASNERVVTGQDIGGDVSDDVVFFDGTTHTTSVEIQNSMQRNHQRMKKKYKNINLLEQNKYSATGSELSEQRCDAS